MCEVGKAEVCLGGNGEAMGYSWSVSIKRGQIMYYSSWKYTEVNESVHFECSEESVLCDSSNMLYQSVLMVQWGR